MIKATGVILVLAFPHMLFAQYQSTLKVDREKIEFAVKSDMQFKVGQEIPVSIEIIAKKETELYDLETGYLRFELFRYNGLNYELVKYNGVVATGIIPRQI